MSARAWRSLSVRGWPPKDSTSSGPREPACGAHPPRRAQRRSGTEGVAYPLRAVRRASALIVGGGPAGASAAIALARGGAAPVLIDRSPAERDLVCGGFLGWDALAALQRLRPHLAPLRARPIRPPRLVAGPRVGAAGLSPP